MIIRLEQWIVRGGQATPPGDWTGGSSYQDAGWVFNTITHEVETYSVDFWVYDDREMNTTGWIVDPRQFWEEELGEDITRVWHYIGNGLVSYDDIRDAVPPVCTLAITSVTVKKVSYFGGANGEATINISGAQGSVKFSLDGQNWQQSPTFTGLVKKEGMHAYVQDSRTPVPCKAELIFDVTQETTPPVCDLVLQGVTITGNAQANSVKVNATSSHLPLRFSVTDWRTEQGTDTFTNLAQGLYTMRVLDAAGCSAEASFQIGVVEPGVINFSRNPIVHQVTGAAPGQLVELELWAETEHYKGDYQKIIVRRKPALLDGTCLFELDTILHALLHRNSELPNMASLGSLQEQVLNKRILNYYVNTAPVNPETDQTDAPTQSEVRTVLMGGLPPEELNDNFFTGHLGTTGAFLTWLPQTHSISPDQPELVSFLLQRSDITILKIRRVWYLAGQSEPIVTMKELPLPAGSSKYRLVRVPVLRDVANPRETRVQITLLDQNDQPLSHTRTYKLDRTYSQNQHFFVYENSLGQLETLRCNGPQEINLDAKDEVAERSQGHAPYLTEQFSYRQQISKKRRQSTGLHSQQYHQQLQDFVIAHRRFELKKNRLLPILLQKRSYTYEPFSNKVAGYFFEYDYAFEPIAYAKL